MAKIVEFFFGKMIAAVDNSTERSYEDWRIKYLDRPGLVVVCESEHRAPGKQFVCIYLDDPDTVPYFRSSVGEVTMEKQFLTIATAHSKYIFEKGDFGMSEGAEQVLYLNVFHNPGESS